MTKIICDINMGVMKQTVYIEGQKYSGKKTLEKYEIELNKLPEFIVKQEDILAIVE